MKPFNYVEMIAVLVYKQISSTTIKNEITDKLLIKRSGKRTSGISVLAARHDDDIYSIVYKQKTDV